MPDVVWDDANVALLRDMHAAGKSFSQIASCIPYATRNAVIGKAYRLGLKDNRKAGPRPKAEVAPAPKSAVKRQVTFQTPRAQQLRKPRLVEPIELLAPGEAMPKSFAELQDGMCKWPLNGGLFCAASQIDGKPYCAHHTALASRPKA
jgi:GcrA cell cycle regulator